MNKYVKLVENYNAQQLDEGVDPVIKQIGDIVKANQDAGLMGLRDPLEKVFKKKDIDFTMAGAAHFQIKVKGNKKVMIVNKKYVNGADLVVGELAIGYM